VQTLQQLEALASASKQSVSEWVRQLVAKVDKDDKEAREIVSSIQQGLADLKAGKIQPIHTLWDRLDD
jgi:predicted transcriptional regulator